MRRLTTAAGAVAALLLGTSPALVTPAAALASPVAALAEPSPAAAAGPPPPGRKMCSIADPRLAEISGIVATASGYAVVNSAVANQPATHQKIFSVSPTCKVATKVGTYAGAGPRSPQDIVRGKDGVLWIADTGDGKDRANIALWRVPATLASPAQIFRFSYPADDKHEAKALLVNGDGTPIIVTFETDRTALLYVPSAAPSATAVVPLKRVGKINILPTATENLFGGIGHKGFNGGAVSPDGTRVVLRTQADAYEWNVSDGDVLAALKTQPRVTGLPMEPISEAITYTADGTRLVTVSRLDLAHEADAEQTEAGLLSYTPTNVAYVAPPTVKAAGGDGWFTRWWKNLSLQQAYLLLAGVGGLGIALVLVGVVGMVKGRKKRAKAAAAAKKARRREEALESADNSETAVLAPVYGSGGYDDRAHDRGYGYGDQGYPPPAPPPPGYPPYGDGRYGGDPGWVPAPPPPPQQPPYGQPHDPYGTPDPNGWGGQGQGRGY